MTTLNNINEFSEYTCDKRNMKQYLIYSTLLAAGVLFLISTKMFDKQSPFYMLLAVTGITIIITAIILLIKRNKNTVLKSTGHKLKRYYKYIDDSEYNETYKAFENIHSKGLKSIKFKHSSGLRIMAMISDDNSFIALQLEKYIPYTFEPVSKIIICDNNDAITRDICCDIKRREV
ncbi:MAG: hypothetical protein PHR20_05470 [Bacteroidales bacterium]|nr:hypothetical protein [Bacteroidales bacterium]